MASFNEHLPERLRGHNAGQYNGRRSGEQQTPPVQVDPAIRTYTAVSAQILLEKESDWLSLPEIPTASEILPTKTTTGQQDVEKVLRSPPEVSVPDHVDNKICRKYHWGISELDFASSTP